MAMKTVTKKMLKWLPISVEMIENLRKDEQSFKLEKNNVVVEDEIYLMELSSMKKLER